MKIVYRTLKFLLITASSLNASASEPLPGAGLENIILPPIFIFILVIMLLFAIPIANFANSHNLFIRFSTFTGSSFSLFIGIALFREIQEFQQASKVKTIAITLSVFLSLIAIYTIAISLFKKRRTEPIE